MAKCPGLGCSAYHHPCVWARPVSLWTRSVNAFSYIFHRSLERRAGKASHVACELQGGLIGEEQAKLLFGDGKHSGWRPLHRPSQEAKTVRVGEEEAHQE